MIGSGLFCQSCHKKVLRKAPVIIKVPKDHERYKSGQSIEELPERFDEVTDTCVKSNHSSKRNGYTMMNAQKYVRSIRL